MYLKTSSLASLCRAFISSASGCGSPSGGNSPVARYFSIHLPIDQAETPSRSAASTCVYPLLDHQPSRRYLELLVVPPPLRRLGHSFRETGHSTLVPSVRHA